MNCSVQFQKFKKKRVFSVFFEMNFNEILKMQRMKENVNDSHKN